MEVEQRLYDYKPRLDSQTWQTNEAKFLAYVCKSGQCKRQEYATRILDVKRAKNGSPFTLIDAVELKYDPQGGQVCLMYYNVKRHLGLSQESGSSGSGPTLKDDVNYQATNKQWTLAQSMKNPLSPSAVEYIFIDPDVCRNCSMAIQKQVDTISKAIWGPNGASGEQFPAKGSAAMLRYFGQTPRKAGQERKGLWTKSFPRNDKGC
jgi:hypothetical protein